MNITVYLGSSEGNDPAFRECTREFGEWIGRAGHTLVFGGSDAGQMGNLCDSVLRAGGKVIGVVPDIPLIRSRVHSRLSEMILTKDMASRRSRMIELGDVFVALPGGIGTLDEITELITLIRIDEVNAPCVMLGPKGFWQPFSDMCDAMSRQGFIEGSIKDNVFFAETAAEAAAFIEARKERASL